VNISAQGYTPQTITIKQGQQVTFTNSDSNPRQLTADASALPGFSTVEPLDQGDTYTYIFDKKGTFRYYDASDPTTFVGTLIVK
jgi:plastocyanin